MTEKQIKLTNTLFLLAFILGLLLRLINLGAASLSDSEAVWALQALEVAHPEGLRSQVVIGAQPAYILLTALLFNLFGSSNFMARFLPALAGSLLVLMPYALRRRFGVWVAVITAFGLAMDPGLVTISRQVDGPMMAVSFGLLALALWLERRPILAGVLSGLALLSGPAIYPGLIILGVVAWIYKSRVGSKGMVVFQRLKEAQQPQEPECAREPERQAPQSTTQPWLFAFGLTILLVGTQLLRYPQGLAAWFQSLAVYLSGWSVSSTTSALKMITAILVYQPVALLFAIAGVGRLFSHFSDERVRGNRIILTTLFWFFGMLVLTVLYPARQVSDLAWALAPLWVLAAFELQHVVPDEMSSTVSAFQAILISILGALFWISLISANRLVGFEENPLINIQIVLLLGILVLGVLSSILVALGWSPEISRDGLIWGLSLLGLIYMISTTWGAAHLRFNQPVELWTALPGTGQSQLMLDTITDLSDRNGNVSNSIEIFSTVDNPSMLWELRVFPKARFSDIVPIGYVPAILITSAEEEPSGLAQAYRGQDFVWWTWPEWDNTLPPNRINWFAFRDAPIMNQKVILWVRGDQFPGEQAGSWNNTSIP